MTDQTNTYKTRLEELLAEITRELQTVGVHDPRNSSDWIAVPENKDAKEPDANDSADNIEEWNERRALVATLEPRYNNIVLALKKITEGTFGSCEICKNSIEEKRLDANPASRTCITHIEEQLN